MMHMVGFVAAIAMPLWNIPLIIRLERRKSASDISILWVLGVFTCILLMLPSALASTDRIFTTFAVLNVVLFGGVVVQVVRYRSAR